MKLTSQQENQEHDYSFPYHYLDLKLEDQRLNAIEYLHYLQKIKEKIQPFYGQKILDIGCGDGRFIYELKHEFVTLVGLDYSEQAIRFARAFNPEILFYTLPLENLPTKETFDVIVLMEILEHIPQKDIPHFLKHVRKHLKKDGKIILSVPSIHMEQPKKHYQHFTAESIQATLDTSFTVLDIQGHGKIGFKRTLFYALRLLVQIFYPLQNTFSLIRSFIPSLQNFYKKHLEKADVHHSLRFIIVAEPKY